MIPVFLCFWILSALWLVQEQRIARLIICLNIYSLIAAVCFLLLAAPDVSMAEAVVSAFSTIFFVICLEKYFSAASPADAEKQEKKNSFVFPFCFTLLLAGLFIWHIPGNLPPAWLKNQYIASFSQEVGGENAVTAIYLGYRMYDTLFEALMLLVSIAAVIHLSRHELPTGGKPKAASAFVDNTLRILCPLLLLFSLYLIANGHISPGGGFHGGVVAAAFFVYRYMIYGIADIRINRVIVSEKIVFLGVVLIAVGFVFLGTHNYLPVPKIIYLTVMNLILGIKVACGFFIVFYRFAAFERSVD